MAVYLHWYDNEDDFENDYWGEKYQEPWFSATNNNGMVHNDADRPGSHDLLNTPLTFEFNENGTFSLGTIYMLAKVFPLTQPLQIY